MLIIYFNTCQELQQQIILIEKFMIVKQSKSEQRNIGESYPSRMEQNVMKQRHQDQPKIKPQSNRIRQYIRQLKRYSILVLILLSIITYTIYVLYHFVSYLVVSSVAFNQPLNEENTERLLSHLDVLCKFTPIFNDRFYQQYIYQLAQRSEYEKVVQKADEALQYSLNKQKFSIHYHKALALCLLQNFIKCKEAVEKALIFATKQKFPQLKYIYNILVSNNIISHEKVPTRAQFNYFEHQHYTQSKKYGGQQILSTL